MSSKSRQFDRIIRAASAKLQAVRSRETWALPPREQAKLAGLTGVALVKATRMKDAPWAERQMDAIWSNAESELVAEVAAAEAARRQVEAEAAAAKVAKKARGWL